MASITSLNVSILSTRTCTRPALHISTPILILHLPLHLPNGHLLLPFLLLILKRHILPYPKHGTIRTSRGTAITHRPHIPTDLLWTSVHTRFTYHMTLPAPISPPRHKPRFGINILTSPFYPNWSIPHRGHNGYNSRDMCRWQSRWFPDHPPIAERPLPSPILAP